MTECRYCEWAVSDDPNEGVHLYVKGNKLSFCNIDCYARYFRSLASPERRVQSRPVVGSRVRRPGASSGRKL